jgi:hypothetical protein
VAASTEHAAKYFARYAEPEALLATAISDSYLAVLVVPVQGESPNLLAGFEAALAQAPGRVLLVLVVNATDSASASTHAENQRLLAHLARQFPGQRRLSHAGVMTHAWLGQGESHDLLWIDRASVGARLPAREGVGTARKLGCDLAALLWTRAQVLCPRIACSDADVTLPDDYFSVLSGAAAESTRSAAWLWPFSHEAGGDPAIDLATVLYEISLRYYVLGLAAARSCYAYQSMGSTLSVDAPTYLIVRGFPKREAAEDFYLLDKLAKVAPLWRVPTSPIRIRARASDRVPFGTGRRTQEIAAQSQMGQEFTLYCPSIFPALAAVLQGLDAFAASAQVAAVLSVLRARIPELAEPARLVLQDLGVFDALASAAQQAPPGAVLRRRIHTWFDALRSLRFVHGLRDRALPSVAWREALSSASFLHDPFRDGSDPAAVCRRLALAEAELPAQIGPSLL